jgi:formiminotetrahydrofolate cyclodeaminase
MAGVRGAHYNVLINISGMENAGKKQEIGNTAAMLLNEAASVTTDIRRHIESVIGG